MKQHITKEQWNELDYEDKEKFASTGACYGPPNIGEMMEFLSKDWIIPFLLRGQLSPIIDWAKYKTREPVDILWEAVKEKLKHSQ